MMSFLAEYVLFILSVLIGIAMLYQLVAIYEVWAYSHAKDDSPQEQDLPPVSILKPLTAWDEEVRRNVNTFCNQDYPAFQVILGPKAESLPALRRLAPCPSTDRREVKVMVCDEQRAVNPKISQVLQMWPAVKHDVIVMADADMRVTPDYLRRVVAPLLDPGVGVVTCFHAVREVETLPALIEALLVNTEYLPNVLVGRRVLGMRFAFGATIALRRDVLQAIGGFESLADYLADDYQIAYRAWKSGYKVVLSDYIVESRVPPMSWRQLVSHQLRWARTNRACQPVGWFFSVVTHLSVWSTAWWVVSGFSHTGWRILILTFLFRTLQTAYYNARLEGLRPAWTGAWLAPVRDLVYFAVWALSFVRDTVEWAGRTYEVFPDGTMREVVSEGVAAQRQ